MQPSSATVRQLLRFFKVGVINTLFGYALYAVMVAIGLQLFVAQAVATIIAVAFNYVSYSRYVFNGARSSKVRFLLSYALNYLVSVAALAMWAAIVPSPYLAGLLATLVAVAVNFVVLRQWVFAPHAGEARTDTTRPPSSRSVCEAIDGASCG